MTTTVTHDEAERRVSEYAPNVITRTRLYAYIAQQRSAAASTQALREAAERLCAAIESRAGVLHPYSPILEEMRALRSALAAETSGRDGGGR